MNYVEIGSANIKGHRVSWANNGHVYVSRELFEKCAKAENICFKANTPREFQSICKQLSES